MHFTQDARVGGSWRGMLRPNDGGKDLWQGGVFREITPPSRVSYTFACWRPCTSACPPTLIAAKCPAWAGDHSGSVGTFGWDGGYGTTWYCDPREDMVSILMTQAMWTSPTPPGVSRDFRTSTYQAIDD